MTVLESFVELVRETSRRQADDDITLTLHVADTVGAFLAGSATSEGKAILKFCGLDRPRNQGGSLDRGEVLTRIAAHAAITRMTEIDGIHLRSGTTPAALLLPTALALASHVARPTAADFADAIATGLEAIGRFGAAIDGQNLVYKGIWTTYLTAPLGTAAVAARLLRLDVSQTAHAMAIALASMSGRIGQPGPGKTSRWLMVGQAARAGCFAAFAAADGFTGSLNLLDGDWMEKSQSIPLDREELLSRSCEPVLREISFKPFCSAKQVIAAISALREALASGFAPEEVVRVVVSVPETYAGMIGHSIQPGNRLGSATSASYQLALAAVAEEGLYDVERSSLVQTPELDAFMRKVSVEVDNSLIRHLPARWPARVTLEGPERRQSATVIDAPGDPGSGFGADEVANKFRVFAQRAGLDAEATRDWLAAAQGAPGSDQALYDLLSMYRRI